MNKKKLGPNLSFTAENKMGNYKRVVTFPQISRIYLLIGYNSLPLGKNGILNPLDILYLHRIFFLGKGLANIITLLSPNVNNGNIKSNKLP